VKISIVCATIGPLDEVDVLIDSVIRALRQTEPTLVIEFIIVDQSASYSDHTFPSSERLQLLHLYSARRGLSFNRNVGLEKVTGDWVMLIDSDCEVSENYFSCFENLIRAHPETGHFIGRILDSDAGSLLFREWPSAEQRVMKPMLWYFATSVNSIFRVEKDKPRFDERFGLGARYGSSEDIDFFLRLKRKRLYTPRLDIFHPNIFNAEIPRAKLDSYSVGFGALCAKHVLPLGFLMLITSLIKKALDMLRGRVPQDGLLRTVIFRTKGFIQYFVDRIMRRYA
jgi:glycosyltransferase involved in cell wall biosynthesis